MPWVTLNALQDHSDYTKKNSHLPNLSYQAVVAEMAENVLPTLALTSRSQRRHIGHPG